MRPCGHRRAPVLLGGAAAAVATWGLVGDRSEPDGYQRVLPTVEVPRAAELAGGTLAVLLGLWVLRAGFRGLPGATCGRVGGRVVAAGVVLDGSVRVLSSATVGANIGGGLLAVVSPVVVGSLVVSGLGHLPRTTTAR